MNREIVEKSLAIYFIKLASVNVALLMAVYDIVSAIVNALSAIIGIVVLLIKPIVALAILAVTAAANAIRQDSISAQYQAVTT